MPQWLRCFQKIIITSCKYKIIKENYIPGTTNSRSRVTTLLMFYTFLKGTEHELTRTLVHLEYNNFYLRPCDICSISHSFHTGRGGLVADNERYLCMKVVLIFGLAGACRREELAYLQQKDVKDEGACFRVVIPNTKTKISREFFITFGDIDEVHLVEIVRQYMKLRPKNCTTRFFLAYKHGKCTKQPIGINTIGNVPKLIAQFLNLPNSKLYTGHCFRRSSTTLLADSGADLLTVKRHGGWRSNSVAEGYIETSTENKKKTAVQILGGKENVPQSSTTNISTSIISNNKPSTSTAGINLYECKDCIINVYNK